ncbi:MAG TPA: hypothetical protein ENN85_05850 [Methanoculleus sp.]|nr:hypothetical protein [Methanoculleus sp.]
MKDQQHFWLSVSVMPIPRKDFDQGATPAEIKSRIIEVLAKNKGYAYTLDEIRELVFGDNSGSAESWKGACFLQDLIKEGYVEEKIVEVENGRWVFYHWK